MEMSLSLSVDQRAEIEQGRPLIAVVGRSQLKCVVVRADLIEQFQYLTDAAPDAGIQEATESLAGLDPEDWKRPEEWRARNGWWDARTLMVSIAVWAVVATCMAAWLISTSHQTQAAHNEQLKRTLIPVVESVERWKAAGANITLEYFHIWLPFAKRTDSPNGGSQYSWKVGNREEGGPFVVVNVDSKESVTDINVYTPEF